MERGDICPAPIHRSLPPCDVVGCRVVGYLTGVLPSPVEVGALNRLTPLFSARTELTIPARGQLRIRDEPRLRDELRTRRRHRRRSWQEEVRAFAPLTVVVDQAGAVVPLDLPLSLNARGTAAGAGKAYSAEGGVGTSGRHVLTAQVLAAKQYAQSRLKAYGWTAPEEMTALDRRWTRESSWRVDATNPTSGAYGIPQPLPATKLASAGADWRTNPRTQIEWGLAYIHDRYGTPSKAWAHSVEGLGAQCRRLGRTVSKAWAHSEATGWY